MSKEGQNKFSINEGRWQSYPCSRKARSFFHVSAMMGGSSLVSSVERHFGINTLDIDS